MKTFWIYFSDPWVLDYPLNKKVFFESYAEVIEAIEKEWINVVILRNDSYIWNWVFSHYFVWDLSNYKRIDEKVKIDLLWNRDSENIIPDINDLEMLNRPEFDEICRDKIKTYEVFKDFSAKTFLLNSFSDLENYIWEIETDKIVLKPRAWEQCKWIYVIDKSEMHKWLYENWKDILLQEFLDSSIWINWLVEWLHEIQVFCINWEFAWSRVKQPAKWSFISSATWSNIWTVRWLKRSEVPNELLKEIKKLDSLILNYPLRLYRADFVNTKKWYKMIEINSRPWVMHKDKEWKEFYWDFNGKVVELVKKYLEN